MSVVFVGGVWFVLGLVLCFLSGRREPGVRMPARVTDTTRLFVARPTLTWVCEADRVALAQLLALPSGTVPAVPAE